VLSCDSSCEQKACANNETNVILRNLRTTTPQHIRCSHLILKCAHICAREHVCTMHLHFWTPTTSPSPSGLDPQLDVVSTFEPPQPWLHRVRLIRSGVVKNGQPPAHMNNVKIFKIWPPRDAPSKQVQLRYKSFLKQRVRWKNQPAARPYESCKIFEGPAPPKCLFKPGTPPIQIISF